jgi:hypothetical protein
MKRKKSNLISAIFLAISFFILTGSASANCFVWCAAICDRICLASFDGNCSDAQINSMGWNCCNQAWGNTPGLGRCTAEQIGHPDW